MNIVLIFIIVICIVLVVIFINYRNDKKIIIGENSNKIAHNLSDDPINIDTNIVMIVDDVFSINGRGIVVTGKIVNGELNIGDNVHIQNQEMTKNISSKIIGIEMFRRSITTAKVGDLVGLLLSDITKNNIQPGDYIKK